MKFKFKNALLAFAALAMVGGVGAGVALGHAGEAVETRAAEETVTYTVASTSSVTKTGTAPSGSTAVYSSTYTNKYQLTKGNSMTLTLSGYDGVEITGLILSMRSNGSGGAGYLSMTSGSTTISSIGSSTSGVAFNNSKWHGSYSTNYVDVTPSLTSTVIANGADIVITIGATVNSLYCQSFTLTYEPSTVVNPSVSIDESSKNLQVEVGQEDIQLTATTKNAGEAAVVWSSSDTDVATIDSATGEVTALASGSTTITAKITVSEVDYTSTTSLYVLYDEPAAVNATIEELLADNSGNYKKSFNVTGVIKGWGNSGTAASPDKYGNLVLEDATGTVIIYGSTVTASALTWDGVNQKFVFTNPQDFTEQEKATSGLTIGSRLTLKLTRCDYTKGDVTTLEACGVITDYLVEEISSLTVTPSKLVYDKGESVSATDLTVSATWAVRGVEEVAFEKLTITPATFTEVGDAETVTVTYKGVSETYTVTVNEKITPITSITIDKTEAIVRVGRTLQLVGTVLPNDTTESAAWSSSDEAVATVDETGLVTGIAVGNATIALEGGSCRAECAITVKGVASCIGEVSDTLTRETTGVTDTSYTAWSGKSVSSDAVYAGNSAGSNESIQLRSNNSSSGIVSTMSGGVITSVEVEWQSATTDGRTLNVYGSNTAYEDAADLYATASQGTLLGTIVKGTSTKLEISDEYAFIGLRSNSGAMYLSSVTIVWEGLVSGSDADMDVLDTLLDEKLYMSTIDPSNVSSGTACLAFYPLAKKYFNGMTDFQKDLFKKSDYCATAKARFEAWAEIAGDSDPYDGQEFEVSAGARNAGFVFNNDSATWLTTISVIAVGALAAAGMVILAKKRKRA